MGVRVDLLCLSMQGCYSEQGTEVGEAIDGRCVSVKDKVTAVLRCNCKKLIDGEK